MDAVSILGNYCRLANKLQTKQKYACTFAFLTKFMINIRKFLVCLIVFACSHLTPSIATNFNPAYWTQTHVTTRHLLDVQMLDFNTIVAVGGNETNDAITSVFRSEDRGASWNIIIDVPFSPWLQAVHFPSTDVGFAAGHDGMVLRTADGGQSWDTLQLPSTVASNHYNDVYFISETVGFLAGGIQGGGGMRTILKTEDGGTNWQIVEHNTGPWLQGIQFVSATVGFAAGQLGTMLKTTNGGTTWTNISPTGNAANRHYNDIAFLDEMNGFAVGGNEQNDSIRTILKTTDGGSSWQTVIDNSAPWLRAIDITPSGTLVAVGNDSTILSSTNGGTTWEKVIVPTAINWAVNLNAVDFIYPTLGVVVGDYGQLLLYEGNLPSAPEVTLNAPLIVHADSVYISGTTVANGAATHVFFDYGPTQSFGSTIMANPHSIAGTDSVYVDALITGIAPGTYYYRIRAENDGGFALSETRQLYIGSLYPDANLDFELWEQNDYHILREWRTMGNAYSSPSYNGTVAATLANAEDSISAIIIGDVDDSSSQFPGGFPVAVKPDSIVGFFNYSIASGTDALILVILKKNGINLSVETNTFTGSSNGTFERLSFPITYSGTEIPDTIILGVANNNPFLEQTPNPNNLVTLDDLQFISSVPIFIPNADFELWDDVVSIHPTNWYSSDLRQEPALNETVFRTEDAQHGHYALILKNDLFYNSSGSLFSGNDDNDWGTFAVAAKHATFNGYYKFEMHHVTDTASVVVTLFNSGNPIGWGSMQISESVSSYTPFEIEIGYEQSALVPDSARIHFYIGNDSLLGASVLYIDNLSFDGFVGLAPAPIVTHAQQPAPTPTSGVRIYPNPTSAHVTIELTDARYTINQIAVYNANGVLVHQKHANATKTQLRLHEQRSGVYFLRIYTDNAVLTKKVILR